MPSGLPLVLRGLWWRRGASAALLFAATLAVAGAAAGPLWGRAAQDSLLTRTLQDAPVSALGFELYDSIPPLAAAPLGTPPPAPSVVAGALAADAVLPAGLEERLDEPSTLLVTSRRLQVLPAVPPAVEDPAVGGPEDEVQRPSPPLGALLWRDGACEQVDLVAGTCPEAATELLLSDRSATEVGVVAGDQVLLPELADEPPPAGSNQPFPVAFTVSGVYRSASVDTGSRFWFDDAVTEYAPPTVFAGELLPARLDAVLVTRDLAGRLRVPGTTVRVERALLADAVSLDDVDRVRLDLAEHVAFLEGTVGRVTVQARLVGTLEGTGPGRLLVDRTAQLVGLQVVLVGWFVLFVLVALVTTTREGELALAKLRGLRGPGLLHLALAEPVALVLLAVPLGLAIATATAAGAAGRALLPGTWGRLLDGDPGALWGPVAVAVGATVAGGAVACALAARRAVRVEVGDQLRRTGGEQAVLGPVATAVLVTVLVVGVVLVRTLGAGAAATMPALLVPVGAGLVAGLLVAGAVRWMAVLARRATRSASLAPFLAVRQLAARGGLTRTTALVTAVTVVAGFAAAAWSVTAQQRDAQAGVDVGADRVAVVARVDVPDLLAATAVVDPDGRWAMAAVERRVDERPDASVLAVDSGRLDAVVARLPGGPALPAGTGARLVPDDVVAPLQVRGSQIEVLAGVLSDARSLTLHLQVRGVTAVGDSFTVDMGEPQPDPGPLTATTDACTGGCTITDVVLVRRGGLGSVSGILTLRRISVDGVEVDGLAAREWRPARVDERELDSAPTGTFDRLQDGIALSFSAPPSASPGVVRRDVPSALPALLLTGTDLPTTGIRQLARGTGLDGGEVPIEVLGEVPTVPRLAAGAVVDLDLADRVQPPRTDQVERQVWLGPAAPPDAVDLLEAAGLDVVAVRTRTERRDELDRSEPAQALLLLLGAGGSALLAGVCGVATALASTARRRRAEGAALEAMAVTPSTVRRVARLEDALVLLPGVLVGGLVGGAVATTSGPVLAAVTGVGVGVAGQTTPAAVWWPVAAMTAATAVLLGLVAVVVAGRRRGDVEGAMRSGT